MSENPPPAESPPPKDFDPRRPMFGSAETPPGEPAGCASIIGRTLLGIVSFALAIVVFMSLAASASTDQPLIGVVVAGALVAGLFLIRKKVGPSPLLGAVVVGVSVAFVVFGGCVLLLSSFK